MTPSKHYRHVLAIGLGGLLCFNLQAAPSLAGYLNQPDNTPSQGLPGRRLGGGSRHPNQLGYGAQIPLIALIPETNLGITTATHPRFLFYLASANGPREIEYVLRNEADELVYETTFSVASMEGIVNIDLADIEGLPSLEANKNYQWYFSIVADDRSQDIVVDGWIRRVDLSTWIQTQALDPDLAVRFNAAEPLEQARILYQEANLWLDAAVILDDLRYIEPENRAVAAEWASLLEAANLPELQSESVTRVSFLRENEQ